MVMTGISETRFNLDAVQGNEVVDFAVLDSNYQVLGNNAAHLTLGNSFTNNQLIAGNLGITGVTRRLTIPVGQPNQQDCLVILAEQPSSLGTWLVFATPSTSSAGQRHTNVTLHGVMPTGITPPAGLLLTLDEDTHRVSIAATNTFQDATVPSLTLAAGGTDRVVIPGVAGNPISVTGGLTMTGNLSAVNGTFTGTLAITGAASFSSTMAVTGMLSANGGVTATSLTISAGGSINGALTVTGAVTLQSTLSVNGLTTLSSLNVSGAVTVGTTLAVTGATTLSGVLNIGTGGAYIQPSGARVQISSLTVTPGATTLGATTVNQMVCQTTIQMPVDNSIYWGDAYHRLFSSSNNWFYFDAWQGWQWRSSSNGYPTVLTLDYAGNLTCQGSFVAAGNVQANSQVFTTPGSLYLRAADGNVHIDVGNATLYVSGPIVTYNRLITNGWDVGWSNSMGGNAICSGYFYQRANGGCRVWDNFDFNFAVAGYGYYLVQRDGNGGIQVGGGGGIYWPSGAAGGRPAYIIGQAGDGWMHWYNSNSVGPAPFDGIGAYGSTGTSNGNWVRNSTIGIDRTGQWVVFYNGRFHTPTDPGPIYYRLLHNGGQIDYHQDDCIVPTDRGHPQDWGIALFWQGFASAGDWFACDTNCDSNGGQTISGYLYCYFIPTPDYPN